MLMRVRVTAHGLLTAAVRHPDNLLELDVPEGIDIRALIEVLAERSPLFDPRSSLAVVEGVKVPLERPLREGEHVHLHLLFGGG
jgi:hypothetical protein